MLLVFGMIASLAVRVLVPGGWWVGTVAFPLAGLVVAYDRILKHTPLGPLAMGGCRFLNVLLGMSASSEPWTAANWTIAAGMGLYITGVTWFARGEATLSKRLQLFAALIVMLAGMTILWTYPQRMPEELLLPMLKVQPQNWTFLWAMLACIIGWRALRAIMLPEPAYVQAAVKTGILSIIVLDAIVVFAVHGPVASIAIFLLLIPTITLGLWVYST
jgi:4-hydroxybenzoate polyprenyltransferase